VAISRVSDRVGQVLGRRYRLLGPIGTGASATVYLADDVMLRRRVAVKVLHAALADDAAFLKRFEAEARAAASLNHPHVMAVHDWGDQREGDIPYLVTELLGGGSLRAMLDSGARPDIAQVRQIGLEAARGLDYAHRRGFVHRDIKPANLLFDDEGRLRIADFGLARALAEAAWTEPMGAVLGTARYASPEQAQGRPLDGRSDVYSLALVLIEAVTGDVPFTADTTLGTLMARVDQTLPVPEALGPLAAAVSAAGHPDPEQRPDAAAFITLLMAAGDLGPVAALPLAGTATIDPDDFEPREPTTLYVPERSLRADLEPEIMAAPPGTTTNGLTIVHEGDEQPATVKVARPGAERTSAKPSRGERRRARKEEKAAEKAAIAAALASSPGDDPQGLPAQVLPLEDGPKERHTGRWIAVVAAAVVLLAGAAFGTWYLALRTPTHDVGDYVGQPVDTVLVDLARKDLVAERADQFDDLAPAGSVLGQDPPPGTTLEEGETVRLTVSLGPPPVALPDPGGKPLGQVTEEFAAIGLTVGEVKRVFDENWDKDTVLGLAPGTPAELPKGSTLGLVVSDGPAPRDVPPGLVGATADAASAAIKAVSLVPAQTTETSETVEKGRVIRVSPSEGSSVPRDSTVTLVVSAGPPVSTIPVSIVGMSVTEATQVLQGLNLTVSGVQGSPANKVTGTTPAVGQSVRHGTAVALITG
jgi:serine/threonine protein kinase/beta-lactam-binding protein with PASTA domain